MDLDKYIEENIDDILKNPNDYVIDKSKLIKNNKPFKTNKKKISFAIDSNLNDYYSDNEPNDQDDYYSDNEPNDQYDYYSDNEPNDQDDNYSDNEPNDQDDNYQNMIGQIEKEPNEDDYTDDIIGELYQNMYGKNLNKVDIIELFKNTKQNDLEKLNGNEFMGGLNIQKTNEISDELANDDGYYFFNLINIFTKYYNIKYDKIEHFFSDIKDNDKGTSSQMELFFDAIVEYKLLRETYKLDNIQCFGMIYSDSDTDKILEIFSKWENQIYMLEIKNDKFISPSLIVCLNYIYESELVNSDWNIYNLRNV